MENFQFGNLAMGYNSVLPVWFTAMPDWLQSRFHRDRRVGMWFSLINLLPFRSTYARDTFLATFPVSFNYIFNTHHITFISMRLKMWLRRARTRLQYRPGGTGYLRAREDFMIRAGQRRATRRYRPY